MTARKENKIMTAKELYEFAKKYNLEDAELEFRDGCYYSVNHAKMNVDMDFQGQNRITLSE